MYKLFLTRRYLLRKKIAIFAILSVWLCVAMVLIVFSVMDGFLDNIKQHSRGLLSDVIVDNATLQGFPYYEEFGDYLARTMPDKVEMTTPVIYNYGIMRVGSNNYTKPVRLVAVNLEEYCKINTFKESLYYEKYFPGLTTFKPMPMPYAGYKSETQPVLPPEFERAFARFRKDNPEEVLGKRTASSPHGVGLFEQSFDEPGYIGNELPGVIVGTDLIYDRDPDDGSYNRLLPRGCEILLTILPLTSAGKIAEDPIPVALRHVDDSRTRVYEIDSMCVYTDFKLMQDLLSMGPLERVDGTYTRPRTSQLLIRLKEGNDARETRKAIQAEWDRFKASIANEISAGDMRLLGSVMIETWQERQVMFIAAVEKEKVLVTVLFVIISAVAIVLIGVIFYMIVMQKTRDIGIIKSVGATRMGVAGIFLMYGAAVGIIGGILGVVSGTVFVTYINDIQDALAQLNPNLRVWSADVYTFDRIPNVVKSYVAVSVFFMAVITSTLGALVPAIKAASVWPVEALRYE